MAATKCTSMLLLAVMLLAGGASAARDLLQNNCPAGTGLIGSVCVNLQNLVNICTNNQNNCCAVGPINAAVLGSIFPDVGNCGGGAAAAGRRLQQLGAVTGVLGTVTGAAGGLTGAAGGLTGAAGGTGAATGTNNACPAGMAGLVGSVCVNAQQVANICTNNANNCCAVGPVNAGVLGNIMGPVGNCGARR